jgi:hypothetical protein
VLLVFRKTEKTGGTMPSSSKIDRNHVSLSTDTQRLYWQAKLGAEGADIAEAIAATGSEPGAIASWLRQRKRAHLRPGEEPPLAD